MKRWKKELKKKYFKNKTTHSLGQKILVYLDYRERKKRKREFGWWGTSHKAISACTFSVSLAGVKEESAPIDWISVVEDMGQVRSHIKFNQPLSCSEPYFSNTVFRTMRGKLLFGSRRKEISGSHLMTFQGRKLENYYSSTDSAEPVFRIQYKREVAKCREERGWRLTRGGTANQTWEDNLAWMKMRSLWLTKMKKEINRETEKEKDYDYDYYNKRMMD